MTMGHAVRALAVGLGVAACASPAPRSAPAPHHKAAASRASDNAASAPVAVAAEQAVHGKLRTVAGQRVLHVWGTGFEMGYAHGNLLRAEILQVIDDYALAAVPPATFVAAAPIFMATADISPALRQEAEGVISGMVAAGGADSTGLQRPLTAADILLLNAITDLVAIGCSSVSAWGGATAADPRLAGELAVVRNLDWTASPALLANQLIIVYEPSAHELQPVVSVAFAGYLGCLSCINEAGVTALFNMGHGDGAADLDQAAAGFAPANLLLRELLSATTTADAVTQQLQGRRHAGSYIVHVVEPAAAAATRGQAPARVLEIEATGVAMRQTEAASRLGSEVLAATNHLRATGKPQACSRYRKIESTVDTKARRLDVDGLWALGESVRIDPDVVHTLLVIPSERSVQVRFREPGRSMHDAPPAVTHRWDDLMTKH